MRIVYGTGNPAKLSGMKKALEGLDLELVGIQKTGILLPKAEETGSTPLENARIKAHSYYQVLKAPVFSCDTGLYFLNLPEEWQPGVRVRRVNGKYMTDQEMIEYYGGLVKKFGRLVAQYRNSICFIYDEDHIYEKEGEEISYEPFALTDVPHVKRVKGYPIDSISLNLKTGQYIYDMVMNASDVTEAPRGFYDFFKQVLEDIRREKEKDCMSPNKKLEVHI